MRNVRLLENRLDKAMIKYNEAAAIHKTYFLIAKRLREERIGFNNQVRCAMPPACSTLGRTLARRRLRSRRTR